MLRTTMSDLMHTKEEKKEEKKTNFIQIIWTPEDRPSHEHDEYKHLDRITCDQMYTNEVFEAAGVHLILYGIDDVINTQNKQTEAQRR